MQYWILSAALAIAKTAPLRVTTTLLPLEHLETVGGLPAFATPETCRRAAELMHVLLAAHNTADAGAVLNVTSHLLEMLTERALTAGVAANTDNCYVAGCHQAQASAFLCEPSMLRVCILLGLEWLVSAHRVTDGSCHAARQVAARLGDRLASRLRTTTHVLDIFVVDDQRFVELVLAAWTLSDLSDKPRFAVHIGFPPPLFCFFFSFILTLLSYCF